MPSHEIKMDNLEFSVNDPIDIVSYSKWLSIRGLAVKSFAADYATRRKSQVEHMLSAQTVDDFTASRKNPTRAARKAQHVRSSMHYHPRLAVASYLGEPVGYAYTTLNISGNPLEKAAKFVAGHNWLNFRELAVDPEFRGHGIATALGAVLLHGYSPEQKVSAYTLDANGKTRNKLTTLGFEEFGQPEPNLAFGPTAEPAELRAFRSDAATLHKSLRANTDSWYIVEQALMSADVY